MRFILYIFIIIGLYNCSNSKQKNKSELTGVILISVNELYNDTIIVEYNLPIITKDSMVFKFPNVIPGTYEYYNSSKYINNLKCFDENNNEIFVIQKDNNSYLIPQSKKMKSIKYHINKASSFDANDVLTKTIVTDSFIVINPISIFGYFDSYNNIPHILVLTKPSDFYTSFSANKKEKLPTIDSFSFDNYSNMIDNPILYCRPDTISFLEANINSTISVYSDNKNITAHTLASWIKPLQNVLSEYTSNLGNKNNPYRYIFIFSDNLDVESALEHEFASVYSFRANWDTLLLKESIQRFVAHEFLHTFTPIDFHSNLYTNEGLVNYSSKHLWLYEGVPEYLALKTLLKSHQINVSQFFEEISKMWYLSNQYKDCNKKSLLDISEHILDERYSECFSNFYCKGALFAFCVDLTISIQTKGKSNLISELKKYKETNGSIFNENDFFNDFFSSFEYKDDFNLKTIKENQPLEFNSFLKKIGYQISDSVVIGRPEYSINTFDIMNYTEEKDGYNVVFNKYSSLKDKQILLLKVNQQSINKSLFLKKIIFPPNSEPIEIEFLVDGKIKSESLKPNDFFMTYRYEIITKLKEQSISMKENLSYLLTER